jgi:hypothetical protein
MSQTERKKVLCPMQNKAGKTYWVRMGSAFTNKDGSTNVYLDALPVNQKLQIRDLTEEDRKPWSERRGHNSESDDLFPRGLAEEGFGS